MNVSLVKFGKQAYALTTIQDITERKQAEVARERYAARLQTLHDIERAILAAQSPHEIGEATISRLRQQIPCRHISISLFDFDQTEMIGFAFSSDLAAASWPDWRVPLSPKMVTQLSQGQVVIVHDTSALVEPSPTEKLVLAEGIRAYCGAPLLVRGKLIGALSLADNQPHRFTLEDIEIVAEVATSLALALDQAHLLEAERTAHEHLQQLAQQLVTAQEEERRRLAYELHDEIGQVMLTIKTNLETLRLTSERATFNTARLSGSIRIASEALEQIRGMALNLHPPLLDDFGLRPALEWYLERQAEAAPFKLNFQSNLADLRFSTAVETNCFRVVQVAITNIARHAQATQVEVRLEWQPEQQVLELSVSDNGQGFDVAAAFDQARHGQSLGLLGMQERIQLIGGQIEIESVPGQGTHIRVRVPVETEDKTWDMIPLRTLLDQLGVQVVGETGDGREVLHLLPSLKLDLVLMDIAMPGLNGLEVTARIT